MEPVIKNCAQILTAKKFKIPTLIKIRYSTLKLPYEHFSKTTFGNNSDSRKKSDNIKLYNLLNLRPNASAKDIKQSYYELAKKYHPDTCDNSKEAYEKFQLINGAYQILGDAKLRMDYDKFGMKPETKTTEATKPNKSSLQTVLQKNKNRKLNQLVAIVTNPEEMFKKLFKSTNTESVQTVDLDLTNIPIDEFPDEIPVKLSFLESVNGGDKDILVPVKKRCEKCSSKRMYNSKDNVCKHCNGVGFKQFPNINASSNTDDIKVICKFCNGSKQAQRTQCSNCGGKTFVFASKKLRIPIPKLVESGSILRLQHPVKRRHINIVLHVDKDDFLKREGNEFCCWILVIFLNSRFFFSGFNIVTETEISLAQAIFGCSLTVKGINQYHYVEIPSGIQPNSKIIVPDHGLKDPQSNRYGDFIVKVIVKIPKQLTDKQRHILKEYADVEQNRSEKVPKYADDQKTKLSALHQYD